MSINVPGKKLPIGTLAGYSGYEKHAIYAARRLPQQRLLTRLKCRTDACVPGPPRSVLAIDEAVHHSPLSELTTVDTVGEVRRHLEWACSSVRDVEWCDLRARGWTLQRIGDAYGVTKERVRQVLDKIEHEYEELFA